MIVWLASFPRSGNTFLRFVLKSLYGIASDTAYPKEAAGRLAAFLAEPRLDAASLPLDQPRFAKTHELVSAGDANPAVYLVRDGRDAYVSYAHFALQLDPDGYPGMSFVDVLRMLVASRDHFGGWSNHVESWTQRLAHTAVLHYEDLLADPAGVAARVCAELAIVLPNPSGKLPTIEELRSIDPLNFRKGKAASWKEEMPPELEQLFWNLHGTTMTRLGYWRDG